MDDRPTPPTRRYADAETALILRRAAELQGTAPDPSASPTLAELEQMAGDAGIEPRYVRLAAAELASPIAASRGNGILGAPETLWLERVVPGEIPASAFDAVVEEIRAGVAMAGHTAVLGRGFTWTSGAPGHPAPPRAITITVTPVDGQTVLRASEALEQMEVAHLMGVGMGIGGTGAMIGIGLALSAASFGLGMAAVTAWAGGGFLAARRLHQRAAARHQRELAALLERLAERCQGLISAPREPGSLPPAPR
ncbi:MAG TPA: hypothetical protein VEQ60_24655 [Longimicrobium sp.]|nr:hypothetical protein [Longimicrobium sp.]